MTGIYAIKNTVNGNTYIGSAKQFARRWRQHLHLLRKGRHHSPYLQAAWNKYGEASFSFDIVATCELEDLIAQEQHYIDTLKPVYNISAVAGRIDYTPEVRRKISESTRRRHYRVDDKTLLDLAKECGVPRNTLLQRMARGWSLEKATSTPVAKHHSKGFELEWQGQKYTLNKLAKHVGISPAALCRRLKLGMTLERAVTMTAEEAIVWKQQLSVESRKRNKAAKARQEQV